MRTIEHTLEICTVHLDDILRTVELITVHLDETICALVHRRHGCVDGRPVRTDDRRDFFESLHGGRNISWIVSGHVIVDDTHVVRRVFSRIDYRQRILLIDIKCNLSQSSHKEDMTRYVQLHLLIYTVLFEAD